MKSVGAVCILLIFLFSGCLCAAVQRELFECTQGVPYKENHCNACFCLSDKTLACNIRKCPQNQNKDLSKSCSTGTLWQEKCNKCWCTNGGIICTNYDCSNY